MTLFLYMMYRISIILGPPKFNLIYFGLEGWDGVEFNLKEEAHFKLSLAGFCTIWKHAKPIWSVVMVGQNINVYTIGNYASIKTLSEFQ